MKKLLSVFILIITLLSLCACKRDETLSDDFKMVATVISVGEKIEVEVTESEYAYGLYHVITADATEYFDGNGKKIKRSDIHAGDVVEILYGGQVMMSYPPQIVSAKITVRK